MIVGIFFAAGFNLYMRGKIMEDEGFSELYFEGHEDLPDELVVNASYSVSHTFTNHEGEAKAYVVEVETPHGVVKGRHVLPDGGEKTITFNFTATGEGHEVVVDAFTRNVKSIPGGDIGLVKQEVGVLGEALSQNLTLKMLPKTYSRKSYSQTGGSETWITRNTTIESAKERIRILELEDYSRKTLTRRPYTVKLYTEGAGKEEELEIHFWATIK